MAEERKTDEQTNEMNDLQAEIIKLENEIAEIDEQLNGFKASHTTDKRRKALKDARYSDEQVERYLRYVTGDNEADIAESVRQLSADFPPVADNYADPNPMNSMKRKPAMRNNAQEYAKTIVKRLRGGGKL